MNQEQDNLEISYAKKFEKFENNPYASDGWDDVADEYVDLGLNNQEKQTIVESVEKENSSDEISQQDIIDESLAYIRARERDQQLKALNEQKAVQLGDIQKNSKQLEEQFSLNNNFGPKEQKKMSDNDSKSWQPFSNNVDPKLVQKQIEYFKLNRQESLKNLNTLDADSKIIDNYGNYRDATHEEVAESERLSNLALDPNDESQFQDTENYARLVEKQTERAVELQNENDRYENPNIFTKVTNSIPFVKESREKAHEQRVEDLSEPTIEEQNITQFNPHLEQKVENQISSGDWHDTAS